MTHTYSTETLWHFNCGNCKNGGQLPITKSAECGCMARRLPTRIAEQLVNWSL